MLKVTIATLFPPPRCEIEACDRPQTRELRDADGNGYGRYCNVHAELEAARINNGGFPR